MQIIITEEQAGCTIRSVLLGQTHVSRSALRRLKFNGRIFLNGVPAHTNRKVAAGDVLTLVFPEKQLPLPLPTSEGLCVAYEDAYLLVVDKPAPLPVIASLYQEGETLQNRVFSHLDGPENFVYRPVNRLDKGTSGLMLIAKDAHVQALMQRQLHTPAFVREYLAVVEGMPPMLKGTIRLPLARGEGIKRKVDVHGKPAITQFHVVQKSRRNSLLRLLLMTGRTHQIRVHMSALGCPLVGDYLYGQQDERLLSRFALHAALLSFRHPLTGEPICCTSPLPPPCQQLLDADA